MSQYSNYIEYGVPGDFFFQGHHSRITTEFDQFCEIIPIEDNNLPIKCNIASNTDFTIKLFRAYEYIKFNDNRIFTSDPHFMEFINLIRHLKTCKNCKNCMFTITINSSFYLV